MKRHSRSFPAELASVRAARIFVGDALTPEAPELVDTAQLLVSELATNCVRHARSGFTLSIGRSRGRMRIGLTDRGAGLPVAGRPGAAEPTGRGLAIVSRLAADWGVTPHRQGKTVWFELS